MKPKPNEVEGAGIAAAERSRLVALRMQMLEMHPFWGYLLLQMKLVEEPGLDTFAATDCVRHIWYNPDRTRELSHAELGFVLAHEIGHQLFQTGRRQAGRDNLRWNMATDYCINRIVAQIGKPGSYEKLYKPPAGILLDRKFDNMIAETVYEQLCGQEMQIARKITVTLHVGDGKGSGGTLKFPNLADHGGGIDIHLPIPLSPEQGELLRDRIAAAVANWQANDQRGHAPGDLLRDLGLLEPPRVPWQRILHRFADQALARDDYSLARPNKRYLEHDVVVPGLYGERVGRVVVALDTSGSMNSETLRAVGKELRGIVDNVEDMTLIVADAKVQQVVGFDQFDAFLRAGKLKGGGGTNHLPVFRYIEENRLNPVLFIGLTDLQSRFPQPPPKFPVIWVTPPRHGRAPWGQVIEVE